MNFYLEISIVLSVIIPVIYLCYKIIPKNKRVRNFFIKHEYFSPNHISGWREKGGIPTLFLFWYGINTENPIVIYFAVGIFTFLAITDLLDGVVARKCNLATKQGAKLDARADKWFDLPTLLFFSFFPVIEPIYIISVIGIIIFDITGQKIRGKNSPPEAGIVGKAKTTIKFILIYLMSLNCRYPDIYNSLKLEIVILVLLFLALLLAGISMGLKTKWYNEYLRKYLEEYL